MGKSRRYDRELELIDRLKRENEKLKRENVKIRRQVERLNLSHDRYRTLRELVHKQTQEERKAAQTKRDWTCFECGKGIMRLQLLPRRDGTFYLRRCTLCSHSTKIQIHNDKVEES